MRPYYKDPDGIEPFGMDWTDYIAAVLKDLGMTLVVQTFAWPAVVGLAVTAETPNGNTAVATLSGGTAGEDYTVTCRATFTNGKVKDQSVVVKVRET